MLRPIQWTGKAVRLLDQTKLPRQTKFVDIADEKQMHDAIRRLVVRGAPAIGTAAAFGVYLGIRDFEGVGIHKRVDKVCDYLATARPTAVNLFWAIERCRRIAYARRRARPEQIPRLIKNHVLSTAQKMLSDDLAIVRRIGEHGLKLLQSSARRTTQIVTHCNAGALASTGALAPIYLGVERGRKFHVFADETRPLLQGSRITAYELQRSDVPVTVICDNMAAAVMSQQRIDAVIVGADRIAANGDAANKIGTLALAIAARHFKVPFYVAAPISTIDMKTKTGAGIPIEQRDPAEVANFAKQRTAPAGVAVYNPAFDVTPAELISAIITERGVLRPPLAKAIGRLFG